MAEQDFDVRRGLRWLTDVPDVCVLVYESTVWATGTRPRVLERRDRPREGLSRQSCDPALVSKRCDRVLVQRVPKSDYICINCTNVGWVPPTGNQFDC
eukprot:COSAG01_NODE_32222_length_584_cov_1.894845_1_plen_98_part_00